MCHYCKFKTQIIISLQGWTNRVPNADWALSGVQNPLGVPDFLGAHIPNNIDDTSLRETF